MTQVVKENRSCSTVLQCNHTSKWVSGLGKIYWTDYGEKTGISSAWEDGSEVTALVTKDIVRPNGLTIDYATNRLYWAGASPCVIASVNLDGSRRRKVVDCNMHHPFAMTLFESRIFWTEWATQSIYTVYRFGRRVPSVLHKDLPLPMDIHV
jgi:sugar lactone lactonase YvrE